MARLLITSVITVNGGTEIADVGYWVALELSTMTTGACVMEFAQASWHHKIENFYVRCVRGK